jgi:hypothetical protein
MSRRLYRADDSDEQDSESEKEDVRCLPTINKIQHKIVDDYDYDNHNYVNDNNHTASSS